MKINEAQQDMRSGYFGGGTGALVSGTVWLIAGTVGYFVSLQASVLTLFFGGMFIFPIAMLLAKLLGRAGTHRKGNPLAPLAMESTVLLFLGLAIAFATLLLDTRYFYPVMLLTIGGRYLVFQTIYGMRLYWLFGGILIASGVVCFLIPMEFYLAAWMGGGIEILFAVPLLRGGKK